jgi:hypothetical protein
MRFSSAQHQKVTISAPLPRKSYAHVSRARPESTTVPSLQAAQHLFTHISVYRHLSSSAPPSPACCARGHTQAATDRPRCPQAAPCMAVRSLARAAEAASLSKTLAALLRSAAPHMAPTLTHVPGAGLLGPGQQHHAVPRPPAAFSGEQQQHLRRRRIPRARGSKASWRRAAPGQAPCPAATARHARPNRRPRRHRRCRPQPRRPIQAAPAGPAAVRRAAQPRLPGRLPAAPRRLPPP